MAMRGLPVKNCIESSHEKFGLGSNLRIRKDMGRGESEEGALRLFYVSASILKTFKHRVKLLMPL